MATYNITDQDELQLMNPISGDTYKLQNDITITTPWTTFNRVWSATTSIDGQKYKIINLNTRVENMISKSTGNPAFNVTSTNYGSTYSYGWWQSTASGTGQFFPIGSQDTSVNGISWSGNFLTAWANNSQLCDSWNVGNRDAGFFVLVVDANGATLYKNGNSLGTKTFMNGIRSLIIYKLIAGLAGTWGVSMREIFITTTALTQAQIQVFYNGGKPVWLTAGMDPGLQNVWHCDEGTGSSLADSISGNTATTSAPYGWNVGIVTGGFSLTGGAGNFKNLIFENPIITSNITTSGNSGFGIVFSQSGSNPIIDSVEVIGGSITCMAVSSGGFLRIGGIVGNVISGNLLKMTNCKSSVNAFVHHPSSMSFGLVGGVLGGVANSWVKNCSFSGGSVTPPTAGICFLEGNGGGFENNVVTGTTATYRMAYYSGGATRQATNSSNYYLDQSSQAQDNLSTGTSAIMKSAISWFYTITNAPMTSWDFEMNGKWSKRTNGSALPELNGRFLANISGTITGVGDGKTIKMSIGQGTPQSTTTVGDTYSFAVSAIENQSALIWIDGDTTKATMVGSIPYGTTDVTGVDCNISEFIIGVFGTQTSFNKTNLWNAYISDTDIAYYNNSGQFRTRNGCKMIIPVGITFTGDSGYTELTTGLKVLGSFIATGYTVFLDNFLLEESVTFNNIQTYGAITLTIGAGKTITSNVFPSNCTYRSTSPGSRYNLKPTSEVRIGSVDIQDCEAIDYDIIATSSTNSGNNDNREASPHLVFARSVNAFLLEHNSNL